LPPTTNSPNDSITCPAAPEPVCPFTKTTLVEATLRDNRNIVANKSTAGNEEKSSGFFVPIAIIITMSPIRILKVNKISKRRGGSGITNIAKMRRTKLGIPKLLSSNFEKYSFTLSRKLLTVVEAI
jgi:hypothetical protein